MFKGYSYHAANILMRCAVDCGLTIKDSIAFEIQIFELDNKLGDYGINRLYKEIDKQLDEQVQDKFIVV